MQVRLKMSWGQWSKGHVFTDMPGGQARTLIERHIAEEVTADPPQPSKSTAFKAPVDRAMRPSQMLRKSAR